MIIKSKYVGDKIVFDHAEDIDPLMEQLKLREYTQNEGGFSHDRTQRYIGTLAGSVIENDPELKEALRHGDASKLLDFFETERGSCFCVNKPNTGRSGKIIIK